MRYRIGIAKRQAADGTNGLLKLAGDAGIHRPVPGVVRTWRKLIHQQLTLFIHEHLHRQQSVKIERFGQFYSDGFGFSRQRFINGRGCNGRIKNMVLVNVLHRDERASLAMRTACNDDGYLHAEFHHRL
jgi:hypothetical protein